MPAANAAINTVVTTRLAAERITPKRLRPKNRSLLFCWMPNLCTSLNMWHGHSAISADRAHIGLCAPKNSGRSTNGTVTNVESTAGNPILARAAIAAAQSWQFAPQSTSAQPLQVTLRFDLNCS